MYPKLSTLETESISIASWKAINIPIKFTQVFFIPSFSARLNCESYEARTLRHEKASLPWLATIPIKIKPYCILRLIIQLHKLRRNEKYVQRFPAGSLTFQACLLLYWLSKVYLFVALTCLDDNFLTLKMYIICVLSGFIVLLKEG